MKHSMWAAICLVVFAATAAACGGEQPWEEREIEEPANFASRPGAGVYSNSTGTTTDGGTTTRTTTDGGTTTRTTTDAGTTSNHRDSGPAVDGGEVVDPFVCDLGLEGTLCQTGSYCSWSGPCVRGTCTCQSRRWTCDEEETCDPDSCPQAGTIRCGESCNVAATNCGCSRGGANFSPCSCLGGEWVCP